MSVTKKSFLGSGGLEYVEPVVLTTKGIDGAIKQIPVLINELSKLDFTNTFNSHLHLLTANAKQLMIEYQKISDSIYKEITILINHNFDLKTKHIVLEEQMSSSYGLISKLDVDGGLKIQKKIFEEHQKFVEGYTSLSDDVRTINLNTSKISSYKQSQIYLDNAFSHQIRKIEIQMNNITLLLHKVENYKSDTHDIRFSNIKNIDKLLDSFNEKYANAFKKQQIIKKPDINTTPSPSQHLFEDGGKVKIF